MHLIWRLGQALRTRTWNGLSREVGGLVELPPEGRVDVGLRQDVAVPVAVERVLLWKTETNTYKSVTLHKLHFLWGPLLTHWRTTLAWRVLPWIS